jgi:hypothetical protein
LSSVSFPEFQNACKIKKLLRIVYDGTGHLVKNDLGVYSWSSITAKKNADNSVGVQIVGCDGKLTNCIPIIPGWT